MLIFWPCAHMKIVYFHALNMLPIFEPTSLHVWSNGCFFTLTQTTILVTSLVLLLEGGNSSSLKAGRGKQKQAKATPAMPPSNKRCHDSDHVGFVWKGKGNVHSDCLMTCKHHVRGKEQREWFVFFVNGIQKWMNLFMWNNAHSLNAWIYSIMLDRIHSETAH